MNAQRIGVCSYCYGLGEVHLTVYPRGERLETRYPCNACFGIGWVYTYFVKTTKEVACRPATQQGSLIAPR